MQNPLSNVAHFITNNALLYDVTRQNTKSYNTHDTAENERVYILRVASCQLRFASCQLRVVSCELSVASCQLRVVSCELVFHHVSSFFLPQSIPHCAQKNQLVKICCPWTLKRFFCKGYQLSFDRSLLHEFPRPLSASTRLFFS